jgi:hypothetical protein
MAKGNFRINLHDDYGFKGKTEPFNKKLIFKLKQKMDNVEHIF